MPTTVDGHRQRAQVRSGIPSDDGSLPIRERSPGEKEAYLDGYKAATREIERRVNIMKTSAALTQEVNGRKANL